MIFRAFLFLLLAASTFTHCHAQMGKIDTKHVSDDSFCVVRIDVKRLVGHLKERKKDFEKLNETVKSEAHLDLAKLQCLTLQFGDPDIDDESPSFAATFEFSMDFDVDVFLKKAFGFTKFEKATINGKSYLKPGSEHDPHIYVESNRKFTMATPGALEAILNAGGGMGQLTTQLKSAPSESEVIAVFRKTKGFDGAAKELSQELRFLALPIKIDEVFAQTNSGIAYINLASGNPIKIQLEVESKEAIDKMKSGLEGLVVMGKATIDPTRKMLKQMIEDSKDDEVSKAFEIEAMKSGIKGLNLAEKMLGGFRVSTKNKMLDIDVRVMEGATELADLTVAGLQLMILGVSHGIEPALVDPIDEERFDAEKGIRKAIETKKK